MEYRHQIWQPPFPLHRVATEKIAWSTAESTTGLCGLSPGLDPDCSYGAPRFPFGSSRAPAVVAGCWRATR